MLHNRHGKLSGFQNLNFAFKLTIFSESLIFSGTRFHILGPKDDIGPDP